jgi:outer membrane protein
MKQIKRVLYMAIPILFASVSVRAQTQTTALNLRGTIDYGLQNNPSSTVYLNNAEIAKLDNKNALANYLPSVNASGTIDYNAKLQTSIIPAGIFGPGTEETRLQIGNKHANGVNIQLDQKIYDQAALIGLKGMKLNSEISDLNVLKNNEQLIYSTARAYYDVLIYNEQEKLLKENEKQYIELLRILQLQYDKGVIKKMDLDRTRVSLNNIISQINIAQTNKQLALNKLKVAIGMPIEDQLTIEDSLNYSQQITLPVEQNFDVTQRYDYALEQKKIFMQELQVKGQRALFLPTVTGYARYGANAYGSEFGPSFKQWFDYSAIGLKVNVPLFNGFRTMSNYKISQYNLQNLQENARLNTQNYKLENQNANTQLQSSYASLTTDKDNMQLAKEVYDASALEYRAGQASLTDFLNSDYSYKQAQSNYINSLIKFLSSRLDYEKSKGTLTTYINQF